MYVQWTPSYVDNSAVTFKLRTTAPVIQSLNIRSATVLQLCLYCLVIWKEAEPSTVKQEELHTQGSE